MAIEGVAIDERSLPKDLAGPRPAPAAPVTPAPEPEPVEPVPATPRRAARRYRGASTRSRGAGRPRAHAQAAREQAALEARRAERTAERARQQKARRRGSRAQGCGGRGERRKAAEAERRKAAEDAARRKEAAEQQAREAELQRRLAAEEEAARRSQPPVSSTSIAPSSSRPSSGAGSGRPRRSPVSSARLHVTQAPGGTVLDVRLGSCNGDAAVRESITNAVFRASPLPAPADPRAFERQSRDRFQTYGVTGVNKHQAGPAPGPLDPVLLVAARLRSAPRQAQLRLDITKGVSDAVPIAVVPFGGQPEGGPADVGVGRGLGPASAAAALRPCPAPTWSRGRCAAMQIRFEDWRLLKSDFLVVGQVEPGGERPRRALRALQRRDRPAAARERSCRRRRAGLRATAHRISDLVFERLTGVRGAFSTRLAYVAVEGAPPSQRYRLIVSDADGFNPRTVADSPEPLMSPAWSPDGQRLAYVSFEGKASAIYVQQLASGKRSRVSARAGINGAPAWSPDGRKLALTLSRGGNLDVYTLDARNADADPRDLGRGDRHRARVVARRRRASTSPPIARAAHRSTACPPTRARVPSA